MVSLCDFGFAFPLLSIDYGTSSRCRLWSLRQGSRRVHWYVDGKKSVWLNLLCCIVGISFRVRNQPRTRIRSGRAVSDSLPLIDHVTRKTRCAPCTSMGFFCALCLDVVWLVLSTLVHFVYAVVPLTVDVSRLLLHVRTVATTRNDRATIIMHIEVPKYAAIMGAASVSAATSAGTCMNAAATLETEQVRDREAQIARPGTRRPMWVASQTDIRFRRSKRCHRSVTVVCAQMKILR